MIERRVSVAQDEIETLNADVMRFMAILGLCLMLVFAAMEGARVSLQEQSQNAVHIMNEKKSEAEIEHIEQEAQKKILFLEQKKNKLMQVLTQIEQKNRELKVSQQELQKEIQQKNKKIQEQYNTLVLNQKNKQTITQNIKQLKQNLIVAKLALMNANKNQQLKMNEHKQKNQDAKKQNNALKKQIKKMKQITMQEKLSEKKVPVKKTSEPIKTEEKGFVLRFSNDDAFVKLLKKKQIQLIYIVDGMHYKVEHSSMIATQPLQGNHQMYALSNETVPLIYKQALSNMNNEKWGVILPHQMRQRLQALIQNNKSGELEIHSTGEVSINVAEI